MDITFYTFEGRFIVKTVTNNIKQASIPERDFVFEFSGFQFKVGLCFRLCIPQTALARRVSHLKPRSRGVIHKEPLFLMSGKPSPARIFLTERQAETALDLDASKAQVRFDGLIGVGFFLGDGAHHVTDFAQEP